MKNVNLLLKLSLVFLNLGLIILASRFSGSDSAETSSVSVACPTGYVSVPHNSTYTASDFCVAKYIASNSAGVAVSVSGAAPWVSINLANATAACQANGANYDLISNAEWQTVAQNIELVGSNWSGGTVGSAGGLSAGTNNTFNSAGVAASSDDTNGVLFDRDACSNTVWDSQRRTFTLSNGNVVWDFAGNVWQWVLDTNSTNFGNSSHISLLTSASNPTIGTVGSLTGDATFLFGPSGNYTALNGSPYGGLGYGFVNFSAGGIYRGGCYFQWV